MHALIFANPVLFLSTLSLRRATVLALCSCGGAFDFYPRSPCGERQPAEHHASTQQEFLSTLSLRRATHFSFLWPSRVRISIHALLAESDNYRLQPTNKTRYFYPRSPCGERQGVHYDNYNLHCVISIHALLAESDSKSAQNSGALLRI